MSANNPIPSGHAALRRGRRSVPGQVYLVTFTTDGRRPLFAAAEAAFIVARASTQPRLWYRSRLLAWVLMPDHWHGLVELGPLDSLSIRIQQLKANTARALHAEARDKDKVWSAGFHDRALRSDDDLLSAARYVVSNPLRAGLVSKLGQYPYWDAVWV